MSKKALKARVITDADIAAIEAAEIVQGTAAPEIDIKQALAEANDAPAALQAQAAEIVPDEAEASVEAGSFQAMFDAVTEAQASEMSASLAAAFAARAQFEREANPENNNIQKTLAGAQKLHLTPGIVKTFVVASVDPNYVNFMETKHKRRNVYAIQKLRDLLYASITGSVTNAINAATLVSLVKLSDVKLPFTGVISKACASDKVAIGNEYKPHMRRHTVSEGTANTQSCSTMTALEVLGVVKNIGTQRSQVWELTSTPLAQRLIEVARTKLMVNLAA